VNGVGAALRFLAAYWVVLVACFSVVGLAVGWVRFGVSPLQAQEERAYRQREYRRSTEQVAFRRRMVDRHLKLGEVFLDSSLLAAAEQEFQQALALDPTNVEAQFGLIKAGIFKPITEDVHQPSVAERRLKFILEERPGDKHALLYLGTLYTTIDTDEARRYLFSALEQDPNLAAAHLNLGFICDLTADPDHAIERYEKALELAEWNQHALNNVSYHYVRQGRFEEAVKKLRLLLSLDGETLIAYWNLSNALRYMNQHEAAYLQLKQLCRLVEDDELLMKPTNVMPWFFETAADGSGDGVLFEVPVQKRMYSLLSLALSCHLTGRAQECKTALRHVAELSCDDPRPAIDFLYANMRRLNDLDGGLLEPLRAFARLIPAASAAEAWFAASDTEAGLRGSVESIYPYWIRRIRSRH
jgi:tetratricopeptide (TPR) repeat protein